MVCGFEPPNIFVSTEWFRKFWPHDLFLFNLSSLFHLFDSVIEATTTVRLLKLLWKPEDKCCHFIRGPYLSGTRGWGSLRPELDSCLEWSKTSLLKETCMRVSLAAMFHSYVQCHLPLPTELSHFHGWRLCFFVRMFNADLCCLNT